MFFFCNHRCLLLYYIFVQFNVHSVRTSWPSSNSSNIKLLGLFKDAQSTSTPTELSVHSHAMFKSAILLSQRYNITIHGQFIEYESAQTGGIAIDALSQACQSVSQSNILGIVGPGLSREAHLIADFGEKIGIPVISYAATDPELSDRKTYPSFYRTVPSDNTAAMAVLNLFIRFNWTSCLIIYQNDQFGSGATKVINQLFIKNNITIRNMIIFDITTLQIRGHFKNSLINSATRIVLLWAEPIYTSIIIQNALDLDVLGPQFTWILSSTFSLSFIDKKYDDKLIGILTVEPVTGTVVDAPINITLLNDALNIWKQYEPETFPQSNNIDYYALFAFDATWTLIESLKQLSLINSNNSLSNTSFCFNRRFIYSHLLFDIVTKTEFPGVSGAIQFNSNITDRLNGSFYYSQNIQPDRNGLKFIPVLDYSYQNNWKTYSRSSVIIWPGNSLVQPSDRAILKGATLTVGVIASPPFTIVTNIIDQYRQNKTQYTGYVPDLIEILRNKIGFIPNIKLAPSNQTYSQLIQAVENGVYDIFVGDVTITSKRRESVDFSNTIFDNSLHIIMRKSPDVSIDVLSFLKPFSRNLWLLTLAACIYAGILLCLIERQDNEVLKDQPLLSQFAMSIWYSFGNIVGYGVNFDVKTTAGRLITVSLYILSLILIASYTANLASNLTLSKTKNIISEIDDIKNGKIPFNRIGIRIGTAGEDYYLREISNGIRNFHPLKSRKELYDSLLDGTIDVSFIDIGVGEYVTNNIYCNLTLIGKGFDIGAFGIVTPKEWLYSQDLDVNILSLRETGLLEGLRQKWFQARNCPDSLETSTAIEIEAMGGLFLTFGGIHILALLLFLWTNRNKIKYGKFSLRCQEKCSNKTKKSKKKYSIKTAEHLQNYQLSSSDLSHF